MAKLLATHETNELLRALGVDPTNVIEWTLLAARDSIVEVHTRNRVVLEDGTDTEIFKRYRLVEVEDCACAEGWVCEAHPDKPMNHDNCGGAGMPCKNGCGLPTRNGA